MTIVELTSDEALGVRDAIAEAMQSSCHILDNHLSEALGGNEIALRDARDWVRVLARLAAVIDKLDPRWTAREGGVRAACRPVPGIRNSTIALGFALDCLAAEATIEQLTAARAAAGELGADEASAQLSHLIDAREGGEQ